MGDLLAEANVSTPAYFYDLSGIEEQIHRLQGALQGSSHLIAYAIKANSAGTIVRTVKEAGAGIDAVSGGELLLARRVGVESQKIVLSGVAKKNDELDLAISEEILAIQAESVGELQRVAERCRALQAQARVSFRINPSVEIDSHSHISTGHDAAKFGIARRNWEEAFAVVEANRDVLTLAGISTHVGSMLRSPESYVASGRVVCDVAHEARKRGHTLQYVDFGGGFGIDYGGAPVQPLENFATAARNLLQEQGLGELQLVMEPGRSIVGPFGALVAQVVQHKVSGPRSWVMIDAGMNDLLRPALYGARHRVEPLEAQPGEAAHQIVGPVCESSDDFGSHALGEVPSHVVLRDAGAYGYSMASEYNARPLPSEVFVRDGRIVQVSRSLGVEDWIARRLQA